MQKSEDQAILLGVPKVEYSPRELTPFPSCLRACANYLGIDVDYTYTMAASGAAFRLTWDEMNWNLGNVDGIFTYDDPERVFRQGIEALGCEFSILYRKESNSKEAFMTFIKEQIDKGNPVIALGIVGPPEACIVTGYQKGGQTLLGWNFFQDNPEFNGGISFDESGYFVTDEWWENADTLAVMSLTPKTSPKKDIKTILLHTIDAMTGRKSGNYAKGLWAYDAWIQALANDNDFSDSLILPLLAERFFTHADAIDCISDGRYNASLFMKDAASYYPEHQALFEEAAKNFMDIFELNTDLFKAVGGWERGELQMRQLVQKDVRRHTISLIEKAKKKDERAFEIMKQLLQLL
jgi:hypothetical protein